VLLTEEELQAWELQKLLFVFDNLFCRASAFFTRIRRTHITKRVPGYFRYTVEWGKASPAALYNAVQHVTKSRVQLQVARNATRSCVAPNDGAVFLKPKTPKLLIAKTWQLLHENQQLDHQGPRSR
jgi:hypothetical protein